MELKGIYPALTTPFENGEVSAGRLKENIERYDRLELAGYLVLGSTGEAVFLDEAERRLLLLAARDAVARGKTLIAGVTAESTTGAIRSARLAEACGADAVLVGTPHYFRSLMTDEALVAHFKRVADASPLPLLLYNVPKFTGLRLSVDVVTILSRHEKIAGLKESSGDLDYLGEILGRVEPGFRVLCGSASVVHPALQAGASGAILAGAVALPEPFICIARAHDAGEPSESRRLQDEVAPAERTLVSSHGIPGIKAALDLRGLYGGPARGPLLPVSREARAEIEILVDRLAARGVIAGREW